MSVVNLEQKLQRLFDSTRRGTEPDAQARERVRAALAVRLAGTQPPSSARRWPNKAATLTVVSGGMLVGIAAWMYAAPPKPSKNEAAQLHSEANRAPTLASVARPEEPRAESAGPTPAPIAAAPPAGTAAPQKRPARVALAASSQAEQESEVALMSALQLALKRGDSRTALELADEHQRRFPRSALSMEREAGRAVARCSSVLREARSAVLADFSKRFPTSPYLSKVEDACSR
jgi:type IV secretory pathway VirB10-like protein